MQARGKTQTLADSITTIVVNHAEYDVGGNTNSTALGICKLWTNPCPLHFPFVPSIIEYHYSVLTDYYSSTEYGVVVLVHITYSMHGALRTVCAYTNPSTTMLLRTEHSRTRALKSACEHEAPARGYIFPRSC